MKGNAIGVFKCLADKSRIRILNYLMDKPMYVELLTDLLELSPSTVSFHLKKLEEAGLVHSIKEQYYVVYNVDTTLFERTLSDLIKQDNTDSRGQQEKEEGYRRKVIAAFFEYGKLKSLPVQQKKRRIVLEEIAKSFKPGVVYLEREVNLIIADINDDFCTIRREMVAEKIFQRENGRYWLA